MCTGAILLYRIPRVVIGENANFVGGEDYLRSRGVEVIVLDDAECKEFMRKYIKENPEVRLPLDSTFALPFTFRLDRCGTKTLGNHDFHEMPRILVRGFALKNDVLENCI